MTTTKINILQPCPRTYRSHNGFGEIQHQFPDTGSSFPRARAVVPVIAGITHTDKQMRTVSNIDVSETQRLKFSVMKVNTAIARTEKSAALDINMSNKYR